LSSDNVPYKTLYEQCSKITVVQSPISRPASLT